MARPLPWLVFALAACGPTFSPDELVTGTSAIGAGSFGLTMLDIGQGDALVVIAPSGCAALLDAGPNGAATAIKAYLKKLGIRRLDFAVVSHFHADHLAGLDDVDVGTDAVAIDAVYDRGGTYASVTFERYASHFAGKRKTAVAGQPPFWLCGEVRFDVLAANGNGVSSTDENAKSVVVKVSYGELEALVGGDLTGFNPDIESLIAPAAGQVEVYKVHHHGSETSSNPAFLSTIRPKVSLISVGISNTYGHPREAALSALQAVSSEVWQTEDPATMTKRGHIEVASSDGARFTVSQGTTTRSYDSVPTLTPVPVTLRRSGSDMALSFDTQLGRRYTVERTLELTQPFDTWPAGEAVPGTGATVTVTDVGAMSRPSAFYRAFSRRTAFGP